jgi:NAD(P)-dependent dehydrogenase (short-subunit alcohol dehydrogenase family)
MKGQQMSAIRFSDRVAIVTGAGTGLGRSHALELARRGARVVVNDLGGSLDGTGGTIAAAEAVAADIRSRGGAAIAHGANVTQAAEVEDMVEKTLRAWGRVDILVNNAGILRDKTFAKMSMDDFRHVVDVHLNGSATCTKAVWGPMREQGYGRVVMTSSSSGLYGNFGQANYSAAKMGVVGLMNTLALEGEKYGIRVNTLSPTAATRMTEALIAAPTLELMTVESVTAGLIYLVSEKAPSRLILCAGAGGYAATRIYETEGIYLPPEQQTAEHVAAHIASILAPEGQAMLVQAGQQTTKFVAKAARHLGTSPV